MTYDEFVTKPLRLSMRVAHKVDDVIIKANIAMNITSVLGERVQSSPENKNEKNMLRYIEAKRELEDMYDELEEVKGEVREFLYDNLPLHQADILEWKYVDGKSLQQISEIMKIEYQTAKNKVHEADKVARNRYQKVQRSTK